MISAVNSKELEAVLDIPVLRDTTGTCGTSPETRCSSQRWSTLGRKEGWPGHTCAKHIEVMAGLS